MDDVDGKSGVWYIDVSEGVAERLKQTTDRNLI